MQKSLGISKETFSLVLGRKLTVPLIITKNTLLQPKGSLVFDPIELALFYSDGSGWIEVTDSTTNTQCIVNEAGDTSVCTDTEPPTDSKTIYFTTDAILRAIFNSGGVFIATAGSINPTTVVPGVGECANFQGDVSIVGELILSIPLSESSGGTGQSTYNTGDTIYASGVDVLSKLPIGSTDQVYTVSGGVPSWQDAQIVQTGPEVPNTQANGDDYEFLPVEIDGNSRFIPLTHTNALNSQNDGLNLICMGTNVCGGVSGNARTKLQNLAQPSTVIGENACGNWNAATTQTSIVHIIGEGALQNLGAGQQFNQCIAIGTNAFNGNTFTQSSNNTIGIGNSIYYAYHPASSNICIGHNVCQNKPASNFDVNGTKIGASVQINATQTGGTEQVLVGSGIMSGCTCTFGENNSSIMIGRLVCNTASGSISFQNIFLGDRILQNAAINGRNNTILGGSTLNNLASNLSSFATCIGGGSLGGAGAGLGTDDVVIGGRTFPTNVAPLNINVTCLGAVQTGVPNASEVMIGRACTAAGVTGRLSFGNAMEAIAATATAGAAALPAAPAGFLVIRHNGTVRKLPVYNN
jgi:hypothetical protein